MTIIQGIIFINFSRIKKSNLRTGNLRPDRLLLIVYKGGHESEKTDVDSIEKRYDPHDQKIIDLLGALNISPLENPLSNIEDTKLVLLKGYISVRNFQTIKASLPILFQLMSLDGGRGKKINNKERGAIENILKLIPMGLELELLTIYGDRLIGILKPDFLSENPDDLLRIYGSNIPGEYYVFGIIDKDTRTGAGIYPDSSDIRKSIDDFAEAIKSMYTQESTTYTITPILIFREVSL
ncbi:MAG: hypothetical protein ACOY9Y_01455 [Bacillota bacterium]